MRVEKQFDEQLLDRRSVVVDLVIARRLARPRRMLQTVQRALARQKPRRLALALELAKQHAQNRIAAKVIVVVEVLIAQRQAEDALRDHRLERMHGHERIAAVGEASRKPIPSTRSPCPPRPATTLRRPTKPFRHRNPPPPGARRPFRTRSPSRYTALAPGSPLKSA